MADCGFQTDAFQQSAFQMCVPTPVPVISHTGAGRYVQIPKRLPKDDDEAIVVILLELLDE